MEEKTRTAGRHDLERQFQVIQDDIVTLSKLLRDIGEEKAGEKRDAALAEAAKLLEQSRSKIHEGQLKARQATSSIEDYVHKQPVQSALIALGVGFLVGMMTRR
jgi:ElaB/YqjD/DUF883 family membrane-anchored ribosome-binding protein